MFQWLPHSFILLLVVSFSNGAITNTTIDDSSGSFKFVGSWNTITPTSPCEICSSKPDASKIHGGTWHDGNIRTGASPTTGSFTFQGSAVYIFGIDQAISQPDIAFTLGSTQAVHHYPGTEQFVYSALFFQATGLAADQTHTVNWVFNVDGSTGVPVQAALFDYAIVTSGQEDVQTTTTSRSPETLSKTPRQSSASASVSAKSASSANQESTSSRSSATSAPESQSSTSISPGTITLAGGTTTVTAQAASSRSKANLGAIIGAVIGALIVAILLAIIFLFLRRRGRVHRSDAHIDKEGRSEFLRIRDDYALQSVGPTAPPDTQADHLDTGAMGYSYPFHSKMRLGAVSTTHAGSTAVSLLPHSPDTPSSVTPTDTRQPLEPPSRPGPQIGTPGGQIFLEEHRFLEERLATLEAQMASQLPPPYVHE